MSVLYAIPIEPLKREVAQLCWGSGCGKGHVGSIVIEDPRVGEIHCVPCNVEECPFMLKQVVTEVVTAGGDSITLRSIKSGATPTPQSARTVTFEGSREDTNETLSGHAGKHEE